jgi:hypothetical protein
MSRQDDIKQYNQMVEKRRILLERFDKLQEIENQLNEDKTLSNDARIKNKQKLLEEYNKVATLLKELTTEAEALAAKLENEE